MRRIVIGLVTLALILLGALGAFAGWNVKSDQKVTGFGHPESVAYDPGEKVLYVGRFGPMLKPLLKDQKGFISKVSLKGKILEERALPAPGGTLNKPKGIWIKGGRLWVTDIDVLWVFDLKSKKGQKAPLPGAVFANDPVELKGSIFISDTGVHKIYMVTPGDFLGKAPRVDNVYSRKGLAPNGVFVNSSGTLMVAGFSPQGKGKLWLFQGGELKPLSGELGKLDGLAVLSDGTILYTDWQSGCLWALKDGKTSKLASGFKGPADFAVIPQGKGYLVVVPDLVTGDLRFVILAQ